MRVVICIKQVPDIFDVKVDPVTGTLMREGVASILNPFCEYAVDRFLSFRDKYGGMESIAVSMGPPQAKAALMRCLEMGIDRAVLLTDRRFAGADTWATAYTLAAAINTLIGEFDLILLGKQAIDGDTAQVGPELAESFGLPQVTYGVGLELSEDRKRLRVRRETEQGYEVIETAMPAVVSVSRGASIRKLCSLQDILDARRKELLIKDGEGLGLDESQLGLQGSLTQVVKVFPPVTRSTGDVVDGADPEEAVERLLEFLRGRRLL